MVEKTDPQRDPKIDISHEALIRHWRALNDEALDSNGEPRGWVAREASDGRIWQGLVANIESAYLPKEVYESRYKWWKDRELTPSWAERHGNQFEQVERLFERSRGHIADEARRESEAEQNRELVKALAIGVVVVSVLSTILLIFLAVRLRSKRIEAESARTEAEVARFSEEDARMKAENARDELKAANQVAVRALQSQWRYTVDAAAAKQKIPLADILVSLEFLPDERSENRDRRRFPVVPQAERTLRDSLHNLEQVFFADNTVELVTFSPDGKLLAVGTYRGEIRLHQIDTGEFRDVVFSVASIAFSPDSARAVTGEFAFARVWETTSQATLLRIEVGRIDAIRLVAWSKDGASIALALDDGTLRICDADTGALVTEIPAETSTPATTLAFSPDSSRLMSTVNHQAYIYDAKDGSEKGRLENPNGAITSASWSHDGVRIATCSSDETALIWNVQNGEMVSQFDHTASVQSVAFSPDSKWLATGCSDNSAKVWDVTTKEVIQTCSGHDSPVSAVAWSPDGDLLATGSRDHTARLFRFQPENEPEQSQLQLLVDRAKRFVPRVLGEDDRKALLLTEQIPQWCRELQKPPFNAYGRFERGLALLKDPDKFDEARSLFEEAARLDPSRATTFEKQRIEAIRKQWQSMLTSTNDQPPSFEDAERLFGEAVKLDPTLADGKAHALKDAVLKLLAVGADSIKLMESTLDNVNDYIEHALELDPNLEPVFDAAKVQFMIDSGQSMMASGRKSEAQLTFQKALAADPNSQDAVIAAQSKAQRELEKTEIAILLALEMSQKADIRQLLPDISASNEDPRMVLKCREGPSRRGRVQP